MSGGTETVRQRVIALVARVLHAAPQDIGDDGAVGVTAGWDSLAQLNILTVIEQEFGLTIEPEDAVDLTTVVGLASFLTARGTA